MHNSMHGSKRRPKNLDLLSVKFPMSAIMSVGHRAAGIVMFLSLPYFLYLLQLSLTNETGFAQALEELQAPMIKVIGLILIWSLAHHLIAGIRYFLLDLDIAIDKEMSQKSAVMVMLSGAIVFAFFFFIII